MVHEIYKPSWQSALIGYIIIIIITIHNSQQFNFFVFIACSQLTNLHCFEFHNEIIHFIRLSHRIYTNVECFCFVLLL